MLDTLGRYDVVKSDWPAIKAGVIASGHAVSQFAASPITAIAVFAVGFGLLCLDRRFGSNEAKAAPPTLTNLSQDSDSLDFSPEARPRPSSPSSAPSTVKPAEDAFAIVHDYGTYAVTRNSEQSIIAVREPPPAGSHAFVIAFTNETLSPHIGSARITFYDRKHSDMPTRVIHNPVWFDNVGNTVSFGVHVTHYLILLIENRLQPKHFFSIEDHRHTPNATLGIEARQVESISTSMTIELTLDGSSSKPTKKLFYITANLKTFSLFPKMKANTEKRDV